MRSQACGIVKVVAPRYQARGAEGTGPSCQGARDTKGGGKCRVTLLFGTTDPGQLAGGLALLDGWTVAMFALSLRLFRCDR
ncbi:hypothetical protein BE17_10310 [Sorangium cellulosum]|uniref:Uncharacterized protein n=1 Tax=Sorangium cellulosum TaxID=56 RepID=A0A150R3N1_SORCE|nr:hypothetical protein BE17_10310 [Sorangium cellulosum]